MGLFSKKSQPANISVDAEATSQAFYDKFMFGEEKLIAVGNRAHAETLKESITKVDPQFDRVDVGILQNELLALRLEVVGLYWLHKHGLGSAVEQSIFTQEYLHGKGLDRLWDEVNDYTQAVAASVVNQAGQSKKPAIYKMRADLADKYFTQYGLGEDESDTGKLVAIAMAINRNDSETAWKKDLTKFYLVLTFWKKLNYGQNEPKLNQSANQQLMFAIRGLYEGTGEEV